MTRRAAKAPTLTMLAYGIDYLEARPLVAELTPREAQVALRMARGQSSREIGVALGISLKTLDIHRSNLQHKLLPRSRNGTRPTTHAALLVYMAGADEFGGRLEAAAGRGSA